jgi:hypothetical protein
MDTIEFRLEVEQFPIGDTLTVNPVVNGVHLRDLARVVEQPSADAEGKPDLAGSYGGLAADPNVRWPSRHFLGEPQETWFGDGDTVLLGCTCGIAGCWPLTAEVVLDGPEVRWHRFHLGHRSWDLSRLGPFRFDTAAYTAALQRTASV